MLNPISRSVSVLFNEPKLLKCFLCPDRTVFIAGFSALQRAEIAEIMRYRIIRGEASRFSALQRAEIAEIRRNELSHVASAIVSVLFNEPKLLKSPSLFASPIALQRFSALQRAEIAEIRPKGGVRGSKSEFQCSSTSRNC